MRCVDRRRLAAALRAGLLMSLVAWPGAAQESFRLERFSVHGGGGSADGAGYDLVLAIGEAERGEVLRGDVYAWRGGVFARLPLDAIFRDGFE